MNIPPEIESAISTGQRARGDGFEGRVIAFTDQPTVTMMLDNDTTRTVVLSVFRDRWNLIPQLPSDHNLERAARALSDAGITTDAVLPDLHEKIAIAMARELDAQAEELY